MMLEFRHTPSKPMIIRFHDDARVLGFDLFQYRVTVYVYNTNQDHFSHLFRD